MWLVLFACGIPAPILRLPEGGRGAVTGTWLLEARGAPPVAFFGLDCHLEGGGAHPDVSCVEVLPGTSLRATVTYRWDGAKWASPLDAWLSVAAPERGLPPRGSAPDSRDAAMDVDPSCRWYVVPLETLTLSERQGGAWVAGAGRAPVRPPPAGPFVFRYALTDDEGTRWLGTELDAWSRAACVRALGSGASWSE